MDEKERDLWVVMFGLGVTSIFYNRLMDWLSARHSEGYTWLTVVCGVGYTLAGVWLVDRRAAWLCFRMFVASGTAMALGDIARHLRRERNGRLAVNEVMRVCSDVRSE